MESFIFFETVIQNLLKHMSSAFGISADRAHAMNILMGRCTTNITEAPARCLSAASEYEMGNKVTLNSMLSSSYVVMSNPKNITLERRDLSSSVGVVSGGLSPLEKLNQDLREMETTRHGTFVWDPVLKLVLCGRNHIMDKCTTAELRRKGLHSIACDQCTRYDQVPTPASVTGVKRKRDDVTVLAAMTPITAATGDQLNNPQIEGPLWGYCSLCNVCICDVCLNELLNTPFFHVPCGHCKKCDEYVRLCDRPLHRCPSLKGSCGWSRARQIPPQITAPKCEALISPMRESVVEYSSLSPGLRTVSPYIYGDVSSPTCVNSFERNYAIIASNNHLLGSGTASIHHHTPSVYGTLKEENVIPLTTSYLDGREETSIPVESAPNTIFKDNQITNFHFYSTTNDQSLFKWEVVIVGLQGGRGTLDIYSFVGPSSPLGKALLDKRIEFSAQLIELPISIRMLLCTRAEGLAASKAIKLVGMRVEGVPRRHK